MSQHYDSYEKRLVITPDNERDITLCGKLAILKANSWGTFEDMCIDAARENIKKDYIIIEDQVFGISPIVRAQQAIGIYNFIIKPDEPDTTAKIIK